jgi:hypothetical protein
MIDLMTAPSYHKLLLYSINYFNKRVILINLRLLQHRAMLYYHMPVLSNSYTLTVTGRTRGDIIISQIGLRVYYYYDIH